MKTSRGLVGGFSAAILLSALVVIASLWTLRQVEESAAVRTHTNAVINSANALLSALKDAESDQHAYSATGDAALMQPSGVRHESIRDSLKNLQEITLVAAARQHLEVLAPLIDAKLAFMANVIELRRSQGVAEALALDRGGEGRRLMNTIRAEIGSFGRIEVDVLKQREAEFQASMRRLFLIVITTTLLALLLALGFAYLIFRETRQQVKNLVHAETQHLLELQAETNRQLQLANNTLRDSEEKLAVTLNSTAHRLAAGGCRRPPGAGDISHHPPGEPGSGHHPGHGYPGQWHGAGTRQSHPADFPRWQ